MSEPLPVENLALIGFMGSGKSVIGKKLSRRLGFEFVDTDRLIETRAGMKISEIFDTHGEAHFRAMESQIVEELRDAKASVIATGGGLVTHNSNLERLKSFSMVVCLCASAEEIWNRVRRSQHRPLLQRPDAQEFITQKLKERMPIYRQADVLVTTEGRSANAVVEIIAHQFEKQRRGAPSVSP